MQRIAVFVLGLLVCGGKAECPDNPEECQALDVTCWYPPQVIKDVAEGWPDSCEGLVQSSNESAASCAMACQQDIKCSVWQYSGIGEATDPNGHCFIGVPDKACRDDNRTNFVINAGQRIQHGEIKIIKSAVGVQVMNLKSLAFPTTFDETTKQERCKEACYTDTTCGVWQFGQGSCWLEHKPGNAATEVKDGTTFGAGATAGEFIMHYCPPFPIKKEHLAAVAGLLIFMYCCSSICCCCIVCFPIYWFCIRKKEKKPKKTRAVKIEKPEEPAVPLFVPQPTVLVQQPSVMYAAPAPTQSIVYTQVAQAPVTQSVSYAAPMQSVSYAAPMQQMSYAAPMQQVSYAAAPAQTVVAYDEAYAVQQPLLS